MAIAVAVTGANGFIGLHTVQALLKTGVSVRACVRTLGCRELTNVDQVQIGDIGCRTDWSGALRGVSVVIHCAGVAHLDAQSARKRRDDFRTVNVNGTRRLIEAAGLAGVQRFVFVSSIGVNGSSTTSSPFSADDAPNPSGAYARSKWLAEGLLLKLARHFGMEPVIVRPCLVFGHGAPGNFSRLVRLIRTQMPLPLGSVRNRRSVVSVEALADLLVLAAQHPKAAHALFLAAEEPAVSTPDLIRAIAKGLDVRPRLFPFPPSFLVPTVAPFGLGEEMRKLCESLEADAKPARQILAWSTTMPIIERIEIIARAMRG